MQKEDISVTIEPVQEDEELKEDAQNKVGISLIPKGAAVAKSIKVVAVELDEK